MIDYQCDIELPPLTCWKSIGYGDKPWLAEN